RAPRPPAGPAPAAGGARGPPRPAPVVLGAIDRAGTAPRYRAAGRNRSIHQRPRGGHGGVEPHRGRRGAGGDRTPWAADRIPDISQAESIRAAIPVAVSPVSGPSGVYPPSRAVAAPSSPRAWSQKSRSAAPVPSS